MDLLYFLSDTLSTTPNALQYCWCPSCSVGHSQITVGKHILLFVCMGQAASQLFFLQVVQTPHPLSPLPCGSLFVSKIICMEKLFALDRMAEAEAAEPG